MDTDPILGKRRQREREDNERPTKKRRVMLAPQEAKEPSTEPEKPFAGLTMRVLGEKKRKIQNQIDQLGGNVAASWQAIEHDDFVVVSPSCDANELCWAIQTRRTIVSNTFVLAAWKSKEMPDISKHRVNFSPQQLNLDLDFKHEDEIVEQPFPFLQRTVDFLGDGAVHYPLTWRPQCLTTAPLNPRSSDIFEDFVDWPDVILLHDATMAAFRELPWCELGPDNVQLSTNFFLPKAEATEEIDGEFRAKALLRSAAAVLGKRIAFSRSIEVEVYREGTTKSTLRRSDGTVHIDGEQKAVIEAKVPGVFDAILWQMATQKSPFGQTHFKVPALEAITNASLLGLNRVILTDGARFLFFDINAHVEDGAADGDLTVTVSRVEIFDLTHLKWQTCVVLLGELVFWTSKGESFPKLSGDIVRRFSRKIQKPTKPRRKKSLTKNDDPRPPPDGEGDDFDDDGDDGDGRPDRGSHNPKQRRQQQAPHKKPSQEGRTASRPLFPPTSEDLDIEAVGDGQNVCLKVRMNGETLWLKLFRAGDEYDEGPFWSELEALQKLQEFGDAAPELVGFGEMNHDDEPHLYLATKDAGMDAEAFARFFPEDVEVVRSQVDDLKERLRSSRIRMCDHSGLRNFVVNPDTLDVRVIDLEVFERF